MARLWQESRISATVLLKQTTCIAFGVPFMSIPLIQQGLRVAPDLNKCIHSVFLKEDLFPQIMGYISLAASTLDTEEAKESKDSRQVLAIFILCSFKIVAIFIYTRMLHPVV